MKSNVVMQSGSAQAYFEDTSFSGTVIMRGQRDDSDSPQTPKSRLGIQERTSSLSPEDSASNLAEVAFKSSDLCSYHYSMLQLLLVIATYF